MKMRLMGASSEMQEAVELLQTVFDVHNVSEEYPNRGRSTDVRLYVDLDTPKRNTLEKKIIESLSTYRDELVSSRLILGTSDNKTEVFGGSSNSLEALKLLTFISSDEFKKDIEKSWDATLKKILSDEITSKNLTEIREALKQVMEIKEEETPKC